MTATFLEPEVAVGAVEQVIHYEYSKPVRNLRQRLVVVPPPRHGRQHRVEWTLDVRGAEAEVLRTGCDGFGNVRIEVLVPEVRSWIEFDVRTAIEFRDEWDPGLLADHRYLEPTRLTAADDAIAILLTGCDRSDPGAHLLSRCTARWSTNTASPECTPPPRTHCGEAGACARTTRT